MLGPSELCGYLVRVLAIGVSCGVLHSAYAGWLD